MQILKFRCPYGSAHAELCRLIALLPPEVLAKLLPILRLIAPPSPWRDRDTPRSGPLPGTDLGPGRART
jgi:hypothetical protein